MDLPSNDRRQIKLISAAAIILGLVVLLPILTRDKAGKDIPIVLIGFLLWCGMVAIVTYIKLRKQPRF